MFLNPSTKCFLFLYSLATTEYKFINVEVYLVKWEISYFWVGHLFSTVVPQNLLCVIRNNFYVPSSIDEMFLVPLFPNQNGVKIYKCRGLPSEMRNFIFLIRPSFKYSCPTKPSLYIPEWLLCSFIRRRNVSCSLIP